MNLFVFGYGYSARHYVAQYAADLTDVMATMRDPERAAALTTSRVRVVPTAADRADAEIGAALAQTEGLLLSVPPGETGDPMLARFRPVLEASPRLRSLVYLSTVGVYGDHGGAWIDEGAACVPVTARGRWRLEAEAAWLDFGRATGRSVHVLRLSGIYGPGRNALVNLRAGTARRIVKPGQVFNRIHVADIGRAIAAAWRTPGLGVWNVTDDEPAPPQDVVAYAAQLLDIDPPPEIAFEDAEMSPMARSFYGECKRVSNAAAKARLGLDLAVPTYREGLQALLAAGEGAAPP